MFAYAVSSLGAPSINKPEAVDISSDEKRNGEMWLARLARSYASSVPVK